MSGSAINFIYALLATVAAVMMFIPSKDTEQNPDERFNFNKPLAAGLSFLIGLFSCIVGAAGAFILIPIMLVILHIPIRIAIATLLGVTFISSIGTTVGKVVTGQVLLIPAAIMVISSLIASPMGAYLSKRINTMLLKRFLALLIVATAINIWFSLLV